MDGEQLDRFNREGYVVLEDVLHPRDLDALHEEYHEILDRLAPRLVASERLTQDYGNLEFGQRYVEMIGEVEEMYDVYQSLDISMPLREGLSPNAEMSTGPAVFSVLTHPQLLDIVEAIVGPEILVNPTQHTRIKPPARRLPEIVTDTIIARTTRHQDFAFLEPEVYETDMLTVWVAVTDATSENGCLLVIPGSHSRGLSLHCPGKEYPGELYIPDELIDLDKAVPLEVGPAGLCFFAASLSTPLVTITATTSAGASIFAINLPTNLPDAPSFLRSWLEVSRIRTARSATSASGPLCGMRPKIESRRARCKSLLGISSVRTRHTVSAHNVRHSMKARQDGTRSMNRVYH